jgi:hypothetical protein
MSAVDTKSPACALAPCGTRAAYKRHLRRGETTDRACCAAETAYRVAYNRRKRAAA